MATVQQTVPAEVPGAPPAPTGKAQPAIPAPARRLIDRQTIDRRVEALLNQVHANRPSEDIP